MSQRTDKPGTLQCNRHMHGCLRPAGRRRIGLLILCQHTSTWPGCNLGLDMPELARTIFVYRFLSYSGFNGGPTKRSAFCVGLLPKSEPKVQIEHSRSRRDAYISNARGGENKHEPSIKNLNARYHKSLNPRRLKPLKVPMGITVGLNGSLGNLGQFLAGYCRSPDIYAKARPLAPV